MVNYLIVTTVLERRMALLWPSGVKRDNIFLLPSDRDERNKEVICLTQAFYREAEAVSFCFTDFNCFLSHMKIIFLKVP